MLNTVYIRYNRCHFNFACEALKYEGQDLVIVIEHPLEIGLDSWSNKNVVPLLAKIYSAIDIASAEIMWATRFGGGLSAPFFWGALDQKDARVDGGWNNPAFNNLHRSRRLKTIDGFEGTVPDIVDRGENLLLQRKPYSNR